MAPKFDDGEVYGIGFADGAEFDADLGGGHGDGAVGEDLDVAHAGGFEAFEEDNFRGGIGRGCGLLESPQVGDGAHGVVVEAISEAGVVVAKVEEAEGVAGDGEADGTGGAVDAGDFTVGAGFVEGVEGVEELVAGGDEGGSGGVLDGRRDMKLGGDPGEFDDEDFGFGAGAGGKKEGKE